MITLINGHVQTPAGLIVPNGSMALQLNVDGTVIAAPGGIVMANEVVVFQFDANGNLQSGAQIYSNKELQPQNALGLGTYYLVTFYDPNGARLNKNPMGWQFPEAANATVDISTMTPYAVIGGNVIFYPIPAGGAGTVTSVAFVGDGTVLSSTPSAPVITAGNIAATLLTQGANTVLAGPTSGAAVVPTFRSLVAADIQIAGAPIIVNSVNRVAQVANVTAQTLFAVGATQAGSYLVTVYIVVSQAASVSSTMPDSRLIYTDQDSGATITVPATASSAGNTTSTFAQFTFIVNAKASTNIQYDIGQVASYASSGATPMQFAYHARAVYLG